MKDKEISVNKIYFKACWLIILFMLPWLACAAGLGKLSVRSSLGQPFKAEIELVSVTGGEIPSLKARVASLEAFRQAGVTYLPFHSSLSVSVEKRVNGHPYIQVTSPHAVDEPFIHLIIELNGSSGRLLREYTVLLDPAEMHTIESVQPISQPTSTLTSGEAIQPPMSAERRSITSGATAFKQGTAAYGPVMQGETLTRIAKQVMPAGGDLNQMLVALYQANRNAFHRKNMNLLKIGVILRIPDQNEILAISQADANYEIRAQTSNWRAHQQGMADAAMTSSPPAELKQAAGRVSTIIQEDNIVDKKGSPEEVLVLSKGDQLESAQADDNAGSGRTDTTEDYLRMLEEDTIAKERALNEANERVALLEQNIEKLQRLLELKNAGMTELQKQAERTLEQAETVLPQLQAQVEAKVLPADSIDSAPIHEIAHNVQSDKIATIQSNIPEQTAIPVSLPDSSQTGEIALSDRITDFVADNKEITGGALVVLLSGWLGISLLRRRREKSDQMDNTDEQADGIANDLVTELRMRESIPAATRDRAKELVKQTNLASGLRESTSTKDEKSANGLAESASGVFFGNPISESLVNDRHADSNHHVATRKLDQSEATSMEPTHDIKFDLANIDPDLSTASTAHSLAVNESEQQVIKEASLSSHGFALDLETEHADRKNAAIEGKGLAFDLDFVEGIKSSAEAGISAEEEKAGSSADKENGITRFNLADIKLDLEDEPKKLKQEAVSSEDKTLLWNEVAVKIDLAKAYMEMDDKEEAREMLDEVMREGDEEQQAVARSMLKELK